MSSVGGGGGDGDYDTRDSAAPALTDNGCRNRC
jgi:hypothetical protein